MAVDAKDFASVQKFLHDASGVVLEAGKEYLVETRLTSVARQAGFASLQDLIAHLRHRVSDELRTQVIGALITTETQFFRDTHAFEVLKTCILPELIDKRSTERRLRLWCGAASSGQEPYSVAMVLLEHFPKLVNWDVQLIASDISDVVLERAQRGCYSHVEVNRGLPAALLQKYFQQHDTQWQLSEHIRRWVTFRQINLIHTWPSLPSMDVILLRNILIYFDLETKKAILGKVRRLLKPDGYLLLGGVETTLNLDNAFKRVSFDRAVYYQLRH